jgi:SNF2 family DNA or RNA helicase
MPKPCQICQKQMDLRGYLFVAEDRKVVGYRNLDQFRQSIEPFFIRRPREEILAGLPPVIPKVYRLPLSKAQKDIYKELERGIIDMPEGTKLIDAQAKTVYFMKSVDGLFALDVGREDSAKLDRLIELLQTDLADESVLIFARYRPTVSHLVTKLSELGTHTVFEYSGGTPDKERDEIKRRFNSEERCIIVGTAAIEKGLNLQESARVVLFFSLPFTSVAEDQILGRLHRRGQDQHVVAIYLAAEGTIDERILENIQNRDDLIEQIFGSRLSKIGLNISSDDEVTIIKHLLKKGRKRK